MSSEIETDTVDTARFVSGQSGGASKARNSGLFALYPRRVMRKLQSGFSLGLKGKPSYSFAAALIVLVAGSGFVLNNQSEATVFDKIGFSAKSLIVNGNKAVGSQSFEYALAPQLHHSIFTFDANLAREELLKNPWLKTADVRKVYPDTVLINVVERQPFAFWKTSNVVTVIARDGVVLGEASPEHLKLPQVVGAGANLAASEFISVVARFPEIVGRASAFVRVAKRRWDIVLKDGTKVLLPEYDWKEALAELDTLRLKRGILDRELVHIDMRLPDRMVLRLHPDTAKTRRENLEKLLKRKWHRT